MKKILLALAGLIVVVGVFTLFNSNDFRRTVGMSANELPPPQLGLTRQEVFDRLTANDWCYKGGGSYHFDGRGSYEYIGPFTDTGNLRTSGRWNFEEGEEGYWFLTYDTGVRRRFAFNRGRELMLWNSGPLSRCGSSRSADPSLAELPEIRPDAASLALADKIAAHDWKRADDFSLEYEPTSIVLKKDWKYVATYRYGECENSGDWYVLHDKYTKGTVYAGSTTNMCDVRPSAKDLPESFTLKFTKDGELLYRDRTVFIDQAKPLPQGIIPDFTERLGGFFSTRIDYERPLRSGVASIFHVKITNPAKSQKIGPKTIQRFALTEIDAYQSGGRRLPDGSVQIVPEIAGVDLGDRVLQPGESYEFSLPVTFSEPGKKYFRINLWTKMDRAYDPTESFGVIVQ